MSAPHCCKPWYKRRKIIKKILWGIAVFIFVVLLTILLIWAILQPSNPKFTLQDATVYAFNISQPNFLTSNFQVTISSRNPNERIGVYYDSLDVYATYRNQDITIRTSIPPTYQGHKEINVWSPFIYGTSVPVAPYNAIALGQDQTTGTILVMIKVDGQVRWKVGTFVSGKYNLNARCAAYISFGNKTSGMVVGDNAVKYQMVQSCTVSV